MKHLYWEIAEYISVGASALGTIAAALSHQAVYAATPLTLALSLNLVNRQQLQKQIALSRQQTELNARFDGLPKQEAIAQITEHLSTLDDQFNNLIIPAPVSLSEIQAELHSQVSESVAQLATEINLKLAQIKPYKHQLVIDRDGSRNLLMEALNKAQSRLIIVCPWLSSYGADEEVIQKIELLLERGVQVNIGWGHLSDIKKIITKSIPKQDANLEWKHENIKEKIEYLEKINASFDIYQRLKAYGGLYRSLPKLQALESQYPQLFQLKLLGTHEKFLVCDDSFAMLGSHNLLTSNTSSSEREIGLLTDDPRIIRELIERYDTANDLSD